MLKLLLFAMTGLALDMNYVSECTTMYPQDERRSLCVSSRYYESLFRQCKVELYSKP